MSKNKQSTVGQIITHPFSLKTVFTTVGIIGIFLALNIMTFQQYKRDEETQQQEVTKKMLTTMNFSNVLGSSSFSAGTSDEDAAFRKKENVKYWYDLLSQKPDFRDAHIILATLAYNDQRCKLAQAHFSQALLLDPVALNNSPLSHAIEKCDK